MTAQRAVILEAVNRAPHHITAEAVVDRVRKKLPGVDASTVYRNLELLEELGYVTHTHFDRTMRWHRAEKERHGHLVCRVCGTETELPQGVLVTLVKKLRQEFGFRADLAHSAIVGLCQTCAEATLKA